MYENENTTTQNPWDTVKASFNFMTAVTSCSDFGAPQNKV